jgi:hypothetical protein
MHKLYGVKWSLDNGYYSNKNYGLLHRYIYTQHFGEIPKGMIIHHIDEDKTNNDINNLQMMTRSEHSSLHILGKNIYLCRKHFKHSKQTKDKISKSHIGKTSTKETKMKMSESHKGKKLKPVIQLSPEGFFIAEFNGISEASGQTGINRNCIIGVCKGKRNKAGGYLWVYKEAG